MPIFEFIRDFRETFCSLADTTNKLYLEALRVNHTFDGELRYLGPDQFIRIQAVFDENIDRMEWGNDRDTGINREVDFNPTIADESGSYNLASRTAVFHSDQATSVEDQQITFQYRAYLPQVPNNSTDGNDSASECNWSDANCWEWGVVPGVGDVATIGANSVVTVDVENVEVDYIYVMGKLKFDESMNHNLRVKGIQVAGDQGWSSESSRKRRDAGENFRSRRNAETAEVAEIEIGTELSPWPCDKTVTITFIGDYTETVGSYDGGLPIGAKALAVYGGVSMFGCPIEKSSLLLKNSVFAGDMSVILSEPVSDWVAGGSVVIASSGVMYDEHDTLTIESVVGDVVTFTSALEYNHFGQDTANTYSTGVTLDKAAEITYHTRNIKLNAENQPTDADWNYGIGGRVLIGTRDAIGEETGDQYGFGQFSNVEFDGMGQFGHNSAQDPRHAVTFYKTAGKAGGFRTVAADSFVKNCAFNNGFWTAIGSYFTDDLEISENVIYHAIDAGLRVHTSERNVLSGNTITYVRHRQLFIQDLGFSLNNSNMDPKATAFGVKIEKVTSTILTDNRVSGMEVGVGYSFEGETCDKQEMCASKAEFDIGSQNSGNWAHSGAIGVWVLEVTQSCSKISGFNVHTVHSTAVYVQSDIDVCVIENINSFDNPMGILPVVYKPDPVTHTMKMKSVTIRNSLLAGLTDTFDCSAYRNWDEFGDYR